MVRLAQRQQCHHRAPAGNVVRQRDPRGGHRHGHRSRAPRAGPRRGHPACGRAEGLHDLSSRRGRADHQRRCAASHPALRPWAYLAARRAAGESRDVCIVHGAALGRHDRSPAWVKLRGHHPRGGDRATSTPFQEAQAQPRHRACRVWQVLGRLLPGVLQAQQSSDRGFVVTRMPLTSLPGGLSFLVHSADLFRETASPTRHPALIKRI
mmetsp:Transcript_51819/g.116709  ORF Transcript_51819/g.116709 Transcript_51819/m.116709 type:complete len:209 (+) Transcript_51819:717-1343(+)